MKRIEKIKTVILLSLFCSSIVMSVMIFSVNSPINMAQKTSFVPVEVTYYFEKDVKKYIKPESYYISFGGNSYNNVYSTEAQNDLWRYGQELLYKTDFSASSLTKVTEETYVNLYKHEGVRFVMPFDVKTTDLDDMQMISWPKEMKSINVSEILIDFKEQTIHIYDAAENIAYNVSTTSDFTPMVEYCFEIRNKGYTDYRSISYLYGLPDVIDGKKVPPNTTLAPLEYTKEVPNIIVSKPVGLDINATDITPDSLVSKVFGNRFDFVKKMVDTQGAQIYMYGYGDRALKIEPTGKITYREKFEPQYYKEINFEKALQIATGRIEDYGYLPNNLYVSDYISYRDASNHLVHDFYFDYKLKDYEVGSYSGAPSVRITITGDQLTYWEENIRQYIMSLKGQPIDQVTVTGDRLGTEFMNINSIISKNYYTIINNYKDDNELNFDSIDSTSYTDVILQNIESMKLKYYSNEEEIEVLIPMWEIIIDGRAYIFDAYSGERKSSYRILN